MPEYERYARLRGEISSSVVRGDVQAQWIDASSFQYQRGGKNFRFDVATRSSVEAERVAVTPPTTGVPPRPQAPSRRNPERGRQFTVTYTSDAKRRAEFKDANVWIGPAEGSLEEQITTSGETAKRTKAGSASWVYGEELGVREAMWWSPDGAKLAYYHFDEAPVKDYYLTLSTTQFQNVLDVEAYPKAGAPNPVVRLFVYDVASKQHIEVDVRNGGPFEDASVGHYVYSIRWSPDGKELLFNRTNRRQNIMEFCAANPSSGKCRVIIREEWAPSWTENSPQIIWLDDKRFIWKSERTGFSNYFLYDVSGQLINPITKHAFNSESIVRVDRAGSALYYMARSGDNPYKLQLHRATLDGKSDTRMTDPKYHHTIGLSPDGKHFVDTYETHSTPPVTRVCSASGNEIAELAKSDLTKFESLGLQRSEIFTFKSADGKYDCYGSLHKPSNFDPTKKYPLLVSVYAGPESGSIDERFDIPSALTELGFLVASFDGRGTRGRGKAFMDEAYMKLGVVEIDDQAAGVKHLAQRAYVDGSRVGIHGTSYGGYASAMAILRHPDTFKAACASSSVTDWRNYDTIYTERYMWIPQENAKGYDEGSCMKYAASLKGDLMLFYGTVDNNVHPANTHQLVRSLQRAGKSFQVQIGPDQGHTGLNQERMLEFFIQSLMR
jgi:dipeptidyl-peptidase-4